MRCLKGINAGGKKVSDAHKNKENRIFTVPNILSVCRILLIPIFIWLYCIKEKYDLALGVLIISGLTDIVDGYIARHFDLITKLGKALDPVADKLTQIAVLICIAGRFKIMRYLVVLIIIKEIVSGGMCLLAINRTKEVRGADWHGKLTTSLLYLTMFLHIFWIEIPKIISIVLVAACMSMMAVSFVLYFRRNISAMKKA